jgi:hypothetical protein
MAHGLGIIDGKNVLHAATLTIPSRKDALFAPIGKGAISKKRGIADTGSRLPVL